MSGALKSALKTAIEHWGEPLPDWIEALARACVESSQNKVARRLGRSSALVSQVLRRKYTGDMEAVEELVRGAFLNATVLCPVKGQLPTDECSKWRDKAKNWSGANHEVVMMYRACKGCPRFTRAEGET